MKRVARLVNRGRRRGVDPTGTACQGGRDGVLGALEGTVIALPGQASHDELLAARATAGVLGLEAILPNGVFSAEVRP